MIYKIFAEDGTTNTITASLEFMLEVYPDGNYEEVEVVIPPASAPQTWLVLSKLGFRSRFTQAEKATIEFAALDNPNGTMEERMRQAAMRSDLADQRDARYIDVRPDTPAGAKTRAGINALKAFGLLTEERVAEICNPIIGEHEAWKDAL